MYQKSNYLFVISMLFLIIISSCKKEDLAENEDNNNNNPSEDNNLPSDVTYNGEHSGNFKISGVTKNQDGNILKDIIIQFRLSTDSTMLIESVKVKSNENGQFTISGLPAPNQGMNPYNFSIEAWDVANFNTYERCLHWPLLSYEEGNSYPQTEITINVKLLEIDEATILKGTVKYENGEPVPADQLSLMDIGYGTNCQGYAFTFDQIASANYVDENTGSSYNTSTGEFTFKNCFRGGDNNYSLHVNHIDWDHFESWDNSITIEKGKENTVQIVLIARTEEIENASFKVNYDLGEVAINGFTDTLHIQDGGMLEKPEVTASLEQGYILAGWYTQKGSNNNDWGELWNFNENAVSSDTTLYAKWTSTENWTPKEYFTYYIVGNSRITIASLAGNTPEDWYYESEPIDTVVGTHIDQPESIIVPAYIDGLPVTHIHSGAFAPSYNEETNVLQTSNLRSVSLPSGLFSIGWAIFKECDNLEEISLYEADYYEGHSMKMHEGVLFSADMTNLYIYPPFLSATDYTTPSGVQAIWGGAFYRANSLKNVTISEGVTSLHGQTFYMCTGLNSVSLPSSLIQIGMNSFDHAGITQLTIPEGVERIESYAFSESGITSIHIPSSVTYIDFTALNRMNNLSSISVEASNGSYKVVNEALMTIDGTEILQFPDASSTTSYNIPEGVTQFHGAFAGSSNLNAITFPSTLQI
ncbi:MAG TPA: leucine-rich repeat protein, partial [Draconibacterium sp.]|nr:leucine-rich repeat protein [Draconibacterium sp.]